MTFQRVFQRLHDECLDVLVERQRKYGRKNIPRFGPYGTVVRLSDKLERLINLTASGRVENHAPDETVEDTLIDIANYANIIRAQLRGWWTNDTCPPLEEE